MTGKSYKLWNTLACTHYGIFRHALIGDNSLLEHTVYKQAWLYTSWNACKHLEPLAWAWVWWVITAPCSREDSLEKALAEAWAKADGLEVAALAKDCANAVFELAAGKNCIRRVDDGRCLMHFSSCYFTVLLTTGSNSCRGILSLSASTNKQSTQTSKAIKLLDEHAWWPGLIVIAQFNLTKLNANLRSVWIMFLPMQMQAHWQYRAIGRGS